MKKGVAISSLVLYVVGLAIVIAILSAYANNIFDKVSTYVNNSRSIEKNMKFEMFFRNSMRNATTINIISSNGNDYIDELQLMNENNVVFAQYNYDSNNKCITYTETGKGISNLVICNQVNRFYVNRFYTVYSANENYNIIVEHDWGLQGINNIPIIVGKGY